MVLDAHDSRIPRLCLTITGVSALTSLGFSLNAVLATRGLDVYALYAASRSIALALVLAALAYRRSRSGVLVLAVILAVVQALDSVVGGVTHDLGKTLGPLILSIATFGSLALALRKEAVPSSVAADR